MGKMTCVHCDCFNVLDVDQCLTDNGGCEQMCINEVPGHVCSCSRGFVLHSDGKSCLGTYH